MSLLSLIKSALSRKRDEPETFPCPDDGTPMPTRSMPRPPPPMPPLTPRPTPPAPTRQRASADSPDPRPGQVWELDTGDSSPWPTEPSGLTAVVLDVKEGWVRFKVCRDGRDITGMRDERKNIDLFKRCYFPRRP